MGQNKPVLMNVVGKARSYFNWAVIVEPGQELGGVPVGVGRLPVPIGPDQIRFVRLHKVHELWKGLLSNEVLSLESGGLVSQEERVEPFVERVVEAEVQ